MIRKNRNYWSDKKLCLIEAKKYSNRTEFSDNSRGAYFSAYKNGWLDDICSHMIPKGNKYKRCIYAYEFPDNHVYVGLTHDIEEREFQHFHRGPVKKHIDEIKLYPIRRILCDYIEAKDAQIKEGEWQNYYDNNGWSPLHKKKPGELGGKDLEWTKEKCILIASKYTNITEFIRACPGAYSSTLKHKWKKEVYSHMPNMKGKCNCISIIAIKDGIEEIFESSIEASKKLNLHPNSITNILNGRTKQTYGYTFKYNI